MKKKFIFFLFLFFSFLAGGNVLASSLMIDQIWSLPSDQLNFNWTANGGGCTAYQGLVCFDTAGNALAGNNFYLANNTTMFNSGQFPIANCLNGATSGDFRIVGYNACSQTLTWADIGNSTYAEFIAGNESTTGYETDGFNVLISYTPYIPPPPLTANVALTTIGNSLAYESTGLATNIISNYWPFVLVIMILLSLIAIFTNWITKKIIGYKK